MIIAIAENYDICYSKAVVIMWGSSCVCRTLFCVNDAVSLFCVFLEWSVPLNSQELTVTTQQVVATTQPQIVTTQQSKHPGLRDLVYGKYKLGGLCYSWVLI